MHPVIQHILSRRENDPVHDGRKIALVLYGGIMLGVRGAAALQVLDQEGLATAFDEIYTMSSGFLNASYFLSGQITDALAAYHTDLSGHRFLNPLKFWKVADIDYLMSVARIKRPLRTDAILQNQTELFLMLTNTKWEAPEYLEVHDFNSEEYFDLVRAASSLPFIGHGNTILHGVPYHDILRKKNIPELMRHVLASDATDILILYNYPWQKEYVNKKIGMAREGTRIMEICLERVPMSRFETNSDKLVRAGTDAAAIMRRFLET
jgi:predicted patatin/cPLA2 family phospholipase